MSIEPEYQPIYKRARDLQYQFHDALGDSNHPMAHTMRQEVQHLVDDIEMHKNPRDLENRIKAIQHQVLEVQSQGNRIMNYEHTNYLHHNYEQMRRDLRRFSNYS
ncbi:MAG TPA: hypothetical protein VMY99_04320 [Nevskiaceae bacterium]|nr:hypothetical protein [Nevskiaceae bacterium]